MPSPHNLLPLQLPKGTNLMKPKRTMANFPISQKLIRKKIRIGHISKTHLAPIRSLFLIKELRVENILYRIMTITHHMILCVPPIRSQFATPPAAQRKSTIEEMQIEHTCIKTNVPAIPD